MCYYGGMMKNILLASVLLAAASVNVSAAEPDQIACLAENMYHEARNQEPVGIIAVGFVVVNRVNDNRFPSDVCKVVRQGGEVRRHKCQFSWYCDGKSDKIANRQAYEQIEAYAKAILSGRLGDPSGGALFYHATYADPYWRNMFKQTLMVGDHIFYRRQ